jgi:Sec-independent protein translocase protein TatA
MSDVCPMSMVFHAQGPTCLLFSGWPVETAGHYILAALAIFLLALTRELVALFRAFREAVRTSAKQVQQMEQQQQRQMEKVGAEADAAALAERASPDSAVAAFSSRENHHPSHPSRPLFPASVTRAQLRWQSIDSVLFVGHLGLGYLLMLLVMTFQVYLFILVLCSSFLVHTLVRTIYEPWFDGWQCKQQDVLKMLARGSSADEASEIKHGEGSHGFVE